MHRIAAIKLERKFTTTVGDLFADGIARANIVCQICGEEDEMALRGLPAIMALDDIESLIVCKACDGNHVRFMLERPDAMLLAA